MSERVRQLAEAFTESLGWPGALASGGSGGGSGGGFVGGSGGGSDGERVIADALAEVVAAPRPNDIRWLRAAAAAWSACGHDRLAAECARRARDLVTGGVAADPVDLAAIARLAVGIRARTGPPGGQRPRWRVPVDGDGDKATRIRAALGNGTPSELRSRDRHSEIVTALWTAFGEFSAGLAHGFHHIGEHRLVVEMVLADIGGHGLSACRSGKRDLMIWAGLSLAKAGDKTSAYACLRIALGQARIPRPESVSANPAPDSDPVRTQAVTTIAGLLAESSALGSTTGAMRILGSGLALGHWLAANRMAGLFPPFLTTFAKTPLGRQAGALLHRQLRWLARHQGWLEGIDPTLSEVGLARSEPIALVRGAQPPPLRSRLRAPGPAPTLPRRPGQHSRTGNAPVPANDLSVAVPIGVRADGGEATLSVRPGGRVALLGPPFDGALLSSVGAWLADDGHAVLVVRPEGAPVHDVERGWHYLGAVGSRTVDLLTSVRTIASSASLKAKVRAGLAAALAPCDDPKAAECLDGLLRMLSTPSGQRAFSEDPDDSDEATHEVACLVVDETAELTYRSVPDLRRAARLVEYLISAVEAIRAGLTVRFTSAGGTRPVACLELPGDPAVAAVRLAAYTGSLVQSWQPSEQVDSKTDFMSKPLVFLTREEEADAALLDAARAVASNTPYPAPPTADRAAEDENTDADTDTDAYLWRHCGIVGLTNSTVLSVLVHAHHDIVWAAVRDWLGDPNQRHALVVAAVRPTVAAVAALAECPEVLAGPLRPGFAELVEIAVGAHLPELRQDGDDQTAVTVRGVAAPPGRTIIWPPHPKGADRYET